jgi:LmeA-like phospholipid-binding
MSGYQATKAYRRPPRSRRRLTTVGIILAVLVVVLVALDFGAKALAENEVANQIQKQGISQKPSVSIAGFPFLTQVISRDIGSMQISWHNLTEGPVTFASINAVLNGVHINSSFNGATVTNLTGTAKITFGQLSNAVSSQVGALGALGGAGLTLTDAGPSEVKANLDLLITNASATWRVSRLSGHELVVELVSSSGLPSDLFASVKRIPIPLSGIPLHLQIQRVSITPDGVVGTLTGQNVTFGG